MFSQNERINKSKSLDLFHLTACSYPFNPMAKEEIEIDQKILGSSPKYASSNKFDSTTTSRVIIQYKIL